MFSVEEEQKKPGREEEKSRTLSKEGGKERDIRDTWRSV